MVKAIWNDTVIAESDNTIVVEGNHYFPKESVGHEYVVGSTMSSVCPWKGEASYYTLEVNGRQNADAAWYYAAPKQRALAIKDHVAFWRGVTIAE